MILRGDEILFGDDPTPGVVAVELDRDRDDRVVVHRREAGRLVQETRSFAPFALLQNEDVARKLSGTEVQELDGDLPLRFLVTFPGWSACERARAVLPKLTGHNASDPSAPYFCPNDPIHQHMVMSGTTCFKGMGFQDPVRLQLDIETRTTPGYMFPNPDREGDEILSIALRENSQGREVVLWGPELGEKGLIEGFNALLSSWDPDVIEGHNLFKFDLAYILTRAKRLKVRLPWGRDGSAPSCRRSRVTIAERNVDYPRVDINGRSVVDTWILAQMVDVSSRDMESYGLKDLARHLGIASEHRTLIDPREAEALARTDPDRVRAYNMDDAREVSGLSELLGASYFIQSQIFPYSHQNVVLRGSATKLNALFCREYLRRRHSLPVPMPGASYEGGYTDVFFEGVARRVVHCDVQSLYPSLMITLGLHPSKDRLGVFTHLLSSLRTFRVQCKDAALSARTERERRTLDAMQQTFKVIINSFYGYLGTDLHNFSDPAVASRITAEGRDLLKGMIQWLQTENCRVIELDTDGIYFIPPQKVKGEAEEARLVERLSKSLPEGLLLEYDGRYEAMFSYKMKNYALLDHRGDVFIKGSGLRSRGVERYLRDFLKGLIEAILRRDPEAASRLYEETQSRLRAHAIPIEDLCKTDTLSEALESYQAKIAAKKRNRAAAYELALRSGRSFVPGDQVVYYISGRGKSVKVFEKARLLCDHSSSQPDENVEYYQDKLEDLHRKFAVYLEGDVLEGL